MIHRGERGVGAGGVRPGGVTRRYAEVLAAAAAIPSA